MLSSEQLERADGTWLAIVYQDGEPVVEAVLPDRIAAMAWAEIAMDNRVWLNRAGAQFRRH